MPLVLEKVLLELKVPALKWFLPSEKKCRKPTKRGRTNVNHQASFKSENSLE